MCSLLYGGGSHVVSNARARPRPVATDLCHRSGGISGGRRPATIARRDLPPLRWYLPHSPAARQSHATFAITHANTRLPITTYPAAMTARTVPDRRRLPKA